MEKDQKTHQKENVPVEPNVSEMTGNKEFVAPGVPIVRSNTSRPRTLGGTGTNSGQVPAAQPGEHKASPVFPTEAPSAPPVPEEDQVNEEKNAVSTVNVIEATPLPQNTELGEIATNEFMWLFEYALEMDISVINSVDRLDRLALPYGPAVLKGYRLAFDAVATQQGQVVATIAPDYAPEAEVWGILYRVPRRLSVRHGSEVSVLDKAHRTGAADGYFEAVHVSVRDTYRGREVTGIAYIATAGARQQFLRLPAERQYVDAIYAQSLLETARKQKLPADYLQKLNALLAERSEQSFPVATVVAEQNTEPLPMLKEEKQDRSTPKAEKNRLEVVHPVRWMMVLSLYFVLILCVGCVWCVLEGLGFGSDIFNADFAPLGIPWYVLVYGLLGGSMSSIVTLGRYHSIPPPGFVLMTWFTRPFIGGIFAGLSYLLLNSGVFVIGGNAVQHQALYSLVGVLAGFCEGWVFNRKA